MTNIKTVANVDVPMKKLAFKYSLTTLLLIPVFVYLGFWQLDRYHEKKSNLTMLENRQHLPVMDIIQADMAVNPNRYRPLKVTGHFLNDHQIYLDNQILKGQPGYRVITPFKPLEQAKILLVDRGWIPVGKSRDELPLIKPMIGKQTLVGIINLPSNGLVLPNLSHKTSDKPFRVQRINFVNLESLLAQKLYPFILQLLPKDPLGFNIQPITFNTPPSRHMAYAIQWFAMALAVFIYYITINRRRYHHTQTDLHQT